MKYLIKPIQSLLKTAILCAVLFLSSWNQAHAQSGLPNTFVDINKVLQAMPGYGDSIKKLDEVRVMYQNQYNYLLVDLQQKIKQFEAKKDSFSPFITSMKLEEIKKGQANLDTFQTMANLALKMQQDMVLTGFLNEIKNTVSEIGNSRKLGTIWDAAMLKNAIWTDPKSDITDEVIKNILNKKNPAPGSGKKTQPKNK